MSETTNKPEPVIFRYDDDLLVAVIKGRHFKYLAYSYYFDKSLRKFKQKVSNNVGTTTFDIDTNGMCSLLVGKELIEVDPVFIPVDTLLLVCDYRPFGKSKTDGRKMYFSHWDKGKVVTFTHGSTSLTSSTKQGSQDWTYWQYPDIAPDNAEIKNDDPFMDKTNNKEKG